MSKITVVTHTTQEVKELRAHYNKNAFPLTSVNNYQATWYWLIDDDGKVHSMNHKSIVTMLLDEPTTRVLTFTQWKQQISKPQTHNNMTKINIIPSTRKAKVRDQPKVSGSAIIIDDSEAGSWNRKILLLCLLDSSTQMLYYVDIESGSILKNLDQVGDFTSRPITELDISYKL